MPYVDQHTVPVDASPDHVWGVVRSLGGIEEFYAPRELWRVRGLLDTLVGGPGYRVEGPGRPLEPGDLMDFWEVVDVRPPTRLRVRAVSRLPGTAYLEIGVHAHGTGTSLTLRTEFEPTGLLGHAYWWSTVGAHTAVFALMTRRLAGLAGT